MALEKGALFFYGDESPKADSVSYTNITNGDVLLEPQLSPKATLTGQSQEIEFAFPVFNGTESAPVIEGVAILGIDGFFDRKLVPVEPFIVAVEHQTSGGAQFIPGELVIQYPNSVQDGALLFIFDNRFRLSELEFGSDVRIKISWDSTPDVAPKIGHVRLIKTLQNPNLADAGFGVRYLDSGTKNRTKPGQQFNSRSTVIREFEISHESLDNFSLYALPNRGRSIMKRLEDITPTITGSASVSAWPSIEWLTTGTILLDYAGAFESGKRYAVDYSLRLKNSGAGSTDVPGGTIGTESSSSPLNLGRRTQIIGLGSNFRWAVSGEGSFAVGARMQMTILDIYEITEGGEALTESDSRSLSDMIAEAGSTGIVGAILRPNSPSDSMVNTVIGTIKSFSPYRDKQGNLTGGGLTIEEIR